MTRTVVRKILLSALVVLIVGTLPVMASGSKETAKKLTIATVNKMDGIPWFDRSAAGLKAFREANPTVETFIEGPPKVDAALQTQMIEDVISQKVSAMVVTPFQPEPLEPVLGKAMAQGIKVVTLEASNAQNVNYDVEAFDNKGYGRHLMDVLAKAMGEQGEYAVFVASLTSKTHNEWVDAAVAYQKEKYPNMKLVGDKNESYDNAQKAYELMQQLLIKYPNIKGVQGSSAYDVVGVGQAVEEAGLDGKIAVVGTSLPSMAGKLLESGAITLASGWDPGFSTQAANKVALLILQERQNEIKDGLDLGVPGYGNVQIVGKVIYGQAWVDWTKDNYKDYNY